MSDYENGHWPEHCAACGYGQNGTLPTQPKRIKRFEEYKAIYKTNDDGVEVPVEGTIPQMLNDLAAHVERLERRQEQDHTIDLIDHLRPRTNTPPEYETNPYHQGSCSPNCRH